MNENRREDHPPPAPTFIGSLDGGNVESSDEEDDREEENKVCLFSVTNF